MASLSGRNVLPTRTTDGDKEVKMSTNETI